MTEKDVINAMARTYNVSGMRVVGVRVPPNVRQQIEESLERAMRFRGEPRGHLKIDGINVLADPRIPPDTIVCLTTKSE